MNEFLQNPNILEELLLQTLIPETKQIDEIISILTRNMKISIEKLRRQLHKFLLSKRKEEFEKLVDPIKNTLSHSDFIFKRIKHVLELYNTPKPDFDNTIPMFAFDEIMINKTSIIKQFEEFLSKFSAENVINFIKIKPCIFKSKVDFSLEDLENFAEPKPISTAHDHLLKSIAFLPYKQDSSQFNFESGKNLKILVTGDMNADIKFRNWVSKNCYEVISSSHMKPINVLRTIKDKEQEDKYYVISGSDDGMMKFWDATSNYYSVVLTLNDYDSVNHIGVMSNFERPKKQDLIVTVGNKCQIKIWDWSVLTQKASVIKKMQIEDLTFVSALRTLDVESFYLGQYQRKNLIITGLENGRFKVWNWKKNNPMVLNVLDEDFSAVRAILCLKQFYKSFHSLIKVQSFYFVYAVGYSNGNIKFYNNKGKLIKNIVLAHEGETTALESLELSNKNEGFCQDYSEIMISGGTDKFIRFWKWRSGEILRVLKCEHKILQNCLAVTNVFDDSIEKKDKYVLVSGGRKPNDICQISIWKY